MQLPHAFGARLRTSFVLVPIAQPSVTIQSWRYPLNSLGDNHVTKSNRVTENPGSLVRVRGSRGEGNRSCVRVNRIPKDCGYMVTSGYIPVSQRLAGVHLRPLQPGSGYTCAKGQSAMVQPRQPFTVWLFILTDPAFGRSGM